jgi:hypothetical protein
MKSYETDRKKLLRFVWFRGSFILVEPSSQNFTILYNWSH